MSSYISHEQFRLKLCLCCLNKGKTLRSIVDNESMQTLIRQFFWIDYNSEDPDVPTVICDSCRRKLYHMEKDNNHKPFTMRPLYEGENCC